MKKEKEIWKWVYIKGEKTKYLISNKNNYRSTYGRRKGNLGIHTDTCGYRVAFIYHNGKRYCPKFHKLVFSAFNKNPNNYPEINHIDGIKINNSPSNLEPCTRSMNQLHANRIGLKNMPKGGVHYKARRVEKVKEGIVVKIYDSIMDAERDGFRGKSISRAAKTGIRHHGFHWKYLDKKTS